MKSPADQLLAAMRRAELVSAITEVAGLSLLSGGGSPSHTIGPGRRTIFTLHRKVGHNKQHRVAGYMKPNQAGATHG